MTNKPEKKNWFVYIVECKNGAYYTGITNNIKRRLSDHNSGRGGYYTRAFGPVILRWKEARPNKSSALKKEARIKRWSRRRKERLFAERKGDYGKD